MGKYEITNAILEILKTKLRVSEELLTEENYDKPLTGRVFQLTAMDMVRLFLEVESAFGCTLNSIEISQYEFNTILGIVDIIMKLKPNNIKSN